MTNGRESIIGWRARMAVGATPRRGRSANKSRRKQQENIRLMAALKEWGRGESPSVRGSPALQGQVLVELVFAPLLQNDPIFDRSAAVEIIPYRPVFAVAVEIARRAVLEILLQMEAARGQLRLPILFRFGSDGKFCDTVGPAIFDDTGAMFGLNGGVVSPPR